MPDPQASPRRPNALRRFVGDPRLSRYGVPAFGVAILIVVFVVVLPRIADYGTVWEILTDTPTRDLLILLGAAVVNVLTFPPPWMAAVPGLGYGHAMVLTQSSTAASAVLPGGDVVGMGTQFAMLRGWGFTSQDATLAVIATGLWNQAVNVLFPVVAVLLLSLQGAVPQGLLTAAEIGGALFVVAVAGFVVLLWRERHARGLGEAAARAVEWVAGVVGRVHRPAWGDAAVRFRNQTVGLVRRRWPHLTVATIVGHLTVWLVLLAALRAVGVGADEVSVLESFAAWSLVRILTAIPITPGGLGIVELGLTGALVAFGGAQEPVVAAVLAYRVLTMVPPIALGGVCLVVWRRMSPQGPGGQAPPGTASGG
jgi:uncharacterized membrane protein YbhN (UPF0104 family)